MNELVVISGKGGTGKTSLVAAFAALAERSVLADCDVDAADLHLLTQPHIRSRNSFHCGHEAVIRPDQCRECGICKLYCRYDAIQYSPTTDSVYSVIPVSCEGCGVCVDHCPASAIDFPERLVGEWYVSDTPHGPMVHARLGIAAENSGKLVSVVRQRARTLAMESGLNTIIVDGPPGIGCPVIASITGATMVLIVTEPTHSGLHDMLRVASLARHFRIPAALCINKWDINPELSNSIESAAKSENIVPLGRVRYDRSVTLAQVDGKNIIEFPEAASAEDIRDLWNRVRSMLNSSGSSENRARTVAPQPKEISNAS